MLRFLPLAVVLVLVVSACVVEPSSGADAGGSDGPAVGLDGSSADSQATDSTNEVAGLDHGLPPGVTADAVLPWPQAAPPLEPACTPQPGAMDLPLLATSGDIELVGSGHLQAVGVEETLELRVHIAGNASLDLAALPTPTVAVAPDMELLSVSAPMAGYAAARVRFKAPGKHTVTASLPDGRKGSAQFQAYTTALPVWEVDIAAPDLFLLMTQPSTKLYYPAKVTVQGKVYPGSQLRLHGGTSKGFPKKSFRIDLPAGQSLPSGERKLVLRGEYNDKTMLRTFLAYQVFRRATWLPVPKTEPIHLRLNGRYYGLMHKVQRLGGDFLTQWGRNPDGELFEADPPGNLSGEAYGNLEPLVPPSLYAQVYQAHAGAKSYAGLVELIEQILTLPDAAFFAVAEGQIKVDDWLVYAATMAALQNHEHIRKNAYWYRDTKAADPRWEVLPWDLDMTLGHLWSEALDVLDEAIITNGPLLTGHPSVVPTFHNRMYRLLDLPAYRSRFEAAVRHAAKTGLDPAFLDGRIAWYLCRAGPDLVADQGKRASNAEYQKRVQEIRDFATGRRAFIQAQLGGQ